MMEKKFPYKSILIICSVNTARSPMAEGFLKDFFSKLKLNIIVKSGGISSNARDGMLISMDARLVMEEVGIKLSNNYLSVDLKKHPKLLQNADLILALTEKHKKEVKKLINPNDKDVFTLMEFAGLKGDIMDPSMKEIEGFRSARDQIIDCLMKGLNKYSF
jgi:protein-tyrosine-phosphatase